MPTKPTFFHERQLLQEGFSFIVGVDEAGAGALAGPLVAAACRLPLNSRLGELNDSKKMSEKKREELFDLVIDRSDSHGIGIVTVEEIEMLGLRPANYLAMRRAIEAAGEVDFALVDAWTIPDITIAQRGIIRGDGRVKSIAAASILAKVTRDRIMLQLHAAHPEYGFDTHKGYGTKAHREAIATHGPCPHHRMTYKTFTDN